MIYKIWIFCVFSTLFVKSAICDAHEHDPEKCNFLLRSYDEIFKSRLAVFDKQLHLQKAYDEILKGRLIILDKQLHKFRRIEQKFDALLAKNHNRETDATSTVPSNCAEALAAAPYSGLHTIKVKSYGPNKFPVYCDATTQGGDWMVIQRRQDGSVDFFRNWADYKKGFGDLNGEFFIGLDKLHALTADTPQELLIVMEDYDNVKKYAKYDSFKIGNEAESYALKVLGSYSGDAGDSLTYHSSFKFSTADRDNDGDSRNCASIYKGAWWYRTCHKSNLNGVYLKGQYEKEKFAQGVNWESWKGYYYSLKSVQMLIRPKRN